MQITINNVQVEAGDGETILEAARRVGFEIPSLCYAAGFAHKSSCMVCIVKDCASGQILPSCSTVPVEGMRIDTESDEVQQVRRLSLELLLSDHRADCQAPCSLVCPSGLDIELMLNFYDTGRAEQARSLINDAFSLPALDCDSCKSPCEKVCRRGTIDNAVSIRKIIKKLLENYVAGSENKKKTANSIDKSVFQSRIGRFTEREKIFLKKNTATLSGCLHCTCAGGDECKLRLYATKAGIKRPRYEASSSALSAVEKIHVKGNMYFEPAKCIRCGLCVYNSDNGFTFKNRGFVMQVVIPDENRSNVDEKLADICPTGALYILTYFNNI